MATAPVHVKVVGVYGLIVRVRCESAPYAGVHGEFRKRRGEHYIVGDTLWTTQEALDLDPPDRDGQQENSMVSQPAFKIELGSKVRDKVTGYTGIIIGRTEWLYGCRRYSVQAQEMKDGKPVEAQGFDEDALEVIDAAAPPPMKDTGGPHDEPSRPRDAAR